MKCNYHSHTEFCDARTSARELCARALESGYDIFGFSSHAPLPFPTEWNLQPDQLEPYRAEIAHLRAEYRDRMDIVCGLEIDYIKGFCGPADPAWQALDLDFRLGAVHYVYNPRLPVQDCLAVDMNPREIRGYVRDWYDNDPSLLVRDYYRAVIELVETGGFDILAHLDLIMAATAAEPLFDAEADWYRKAVLETVEAVAASDCIVEINTGGLARNKHSAVYPAVWILRELRQRRVPVCVCADAHHPDHLDPWYRFGIEAAQAAGYTELCGIRRGARFMYGDFR